MRFLPTPVLWLECKLLTWSRVGSRRSGEGWGIRRARSCQNYPMYQHSR